MIDKNSHILIISTSWYMDYINNMVDISMEVIRNQKFNGIELKTEVYKVPGSLELAQLASHEMLYGGRGSNCVGIILHGIVIRGETSHYDLVTQETFRSIGALAEKFEYVAIINNVICVENENQLKERLEKNTKNNTKGLIELIRAKEL